MAKVDKKDEVCGSCGMERRPDTQFCYNCGKSLSGVGEKEKSLADLESALAAEFPPPADTKKKLESAAAQRRLARKGTRKTVEIHWEPLPEEGNRLYYLFVVMIFVLALGLVYFTVFSR